MSTKIVGDEDGDSEGCGCVAASSGSSKSVIALFAVALLVWRGRP